MDYKRMFELKQDDWLDACKEIDHLKTQVSELTKQAESAKELCHVIAVMERENTQFKQQRDEQRALYERKREQVMRFCKRNDELKAQLAERDALAVRILREQFEKCQKGMRVSYYIAAEVLAIELAMHAKPTDVGRCKHDVHGNDCFECYPTDGPGNEGEL